MWSFFLVACSVDPTGTYVNGNERIVVTGFEDDKGTANVSNINLPNYGIINYTGYGIVIAVYMTASNDKYLKYFRTMINGITIEGTIHLKNEVIVISAKTYSKQ